MSEASTPAPAGPAYYLTTGGNGYSPDGTLPAGAVACSQAQYADASAWTVSNGAIVAAVPTAAETAATALAALQVQARGALDASDRTILRCAENNMAVPGTWTAYRKALRAIVDGTNATATALPPAPAYPAGT